MQPHILQNEDLCETCSYKTEYFQRFLTGTDYVLCTISAAEYLGLCNWTTSPQVYVWTRQECIDRNIQITWEHGLWHTTVNQTINDLLSDPTIDEQVILESLADQYYKNQYADLTIRQENQKAFQQFRMLAEEYYTQ